MSNNQVRKLIAFFILLNLSLADEENKVVGEGNLVTGLKGNTVEGQGNVLNAVDLGGMRKELIGQEEEGK
jgi:hypothetical protein